MYSCFSSLLGTQEDIDDKVHYVIDGGFLLHRVIRPKNVTYAQICEEYVKYVLKNYDRNATIVFNGYEDNSNNTKMFERSRRSFKAKGVNVQCSENSEVGTKKYVDLNELRFQHFAQKLDTK